MPTVARGTEELLAPISSARPAGEDLRGTADWVEIRNARPNTSDTGDKGQWQAVESSKASWQLLRELTSEAIEHKSKDLRLALWLTEANIRLYGFAGLRDSLQLIRELLLRFWNSGLYPLITDGDVEMRSGPLEWLNEKLADIIRELPLTARTEPGDDYSFAYYLESRRPHGMISAGDFEAAVAATKVEHFDSLLKDLIEASDEMSKLEAVCAEKFAAHAPSFAQTRETIADIRTLLEKIVNKKRPPSGPSPGDSQPKDKEKLTPGSFNPLPNLELSEANGASWAQAERLARSGQIDQALAEMTRLAATEGTGRARFHRKLILADICLSTHRDKLAKVILEEMAELIEKHALDTWETSEVVGGVWTRLYGCYRNEKAGIADDEKAASLFLKLCRLDPWQALRCDDGRS